MKMDKNANEMSYGQRPNLVGVAGDSVHRCIETKDLSAHRVGRLWRCMRSEIDEPGHAGLARELDQGKGNS